MKTVEFDYDISAKVIVKAIEREGEIDALCQDICGKQYRVVYWNNGDRKSVWMYAWEIKPCK